MANPQQIIAMVKEKPQILIGVGVALVGLILLLIMMNPFGGGGDSKGPCSQELDKDQMVLANVPSPGRAIEIQALLSRQGVIVDRLEVEGGNNQIRFRKGASICDRDQGLIALVQSGLMDRNIGLEAFDKGDLTSSREEKRIKLIRAQQGELARLIRKIHPVEDATVNLSIPEPSIFRKNKHPMSASVQVTIPSGSRLESNQVRSIINLVVGSIQGLDASHVALADTNGNTYNSVLGPEDELGSKIEERDQYMKHKVAGQLDKLVGVGHYVVTVSTQLREASLEVMTQRFDPTQSVVSSKQRFSEELNSKSGANSPGGPTSSYVPKELQSFVGGDSSSKRGYNRVGEEVSYSNTKTQTVETNRPGMVEDISIAVTVDESHYPKVSTKKGDAAEMSLDEFKRLVARAASPKVRIDNVSVARIKFSSNMAGVPFGEEGLGSESSNSAGLFGTSQGDGPNWLLWIGVGLGVLVLAGVGSVVFQRLTSSSSQSQALEITRLQEISRQQQEQLKMTQQQTEQLLNAQQQQMMGTSAGIPVGNLTGQQVMAGGMPQGQPGDGQSGLAGQAGMNMPLGTVPEVTENQQVAEEMNQTLDMLRTRLGDEPIDQEEMNASIQDFMNS